MMMMVDAPRAPAVIYYAFIHSFALHVEGGRAFARFA